MSAPRIVEPYRSSTPSDVSTAASRLSALLPSSSAASSSTSLPAVLTSRSTSPLPGSASTSPVATKKLGLTPVGIYDRPIIKGKGIGGGGGVGGVVGAGAAGAGSAGSVVGGQGGQVALAAWAFLFAESVRYTQQRVDSIGDLEKRLNILGYHVGVRLLSLTILRETATPAASTTSLFRSTTQAVNPPRLTRLLPTLSWIHSTLWKVVVGRPADALERSNENPDEYMISDNDLVLTKSVAVPPEMNQLSCGAVMAGIVEAALDGLGFPARVTSHAVPSPAFPKRTTILIKLEPAVVQREQALEGIPPR